MMRLCYLLDGLWRCMISIRALYRKYYSQATGWLSENFTAEYHFRICKGNKFCFVKSVEKYECCTLAKRLGARSPGIWFGTIVLVRFKGSIA